MKTKLISKFVFLPLMILFLAVVQIFVSPLLLSKPTAAEEVYYAKIESEGTYFCSTPSTASALFEIPESYFVQVSGVVDEFYEVTYKNLSGYVLRESATLMNGTPSSPFASATFSLFVAYNLFSSASETTALTSLPSGQVLTYFGTKTGTAVKSDNSVWFFCSVSTDSGTLFGYVYSGVTDHLTTISTNTESFSVLSDDVFFGSETELSSLSVGTKILLIVAISVPSLLILYFLIKPSRILSASRAVKKPKKTSHRAKGRADYFEFDESELS